MNWNALSDNELIARYQSGDETSKDTKAVLLYDETAGLRCSVGGQPQVYHIHLS